MLAELDDQTPANQCVALAEKIGKTPHAKIEVQLYKGAQHAWEVLGAAPYYEAKAENYSRCLAHIEDDGRSISDKDGSTIPSSRKELFDWTRRNCMTYGTYCCGGNKEQKQRATADLIAFFRRSGF
jgi:dienelactone hydrolase